jgi:hypothetical protein
MADEVAASQEQPVTDSQDQDLPDASQEQAAPDSDQDDTAEAPDNDAQADEPEYEVTVDGQTLKVKHSELLKGYSRNADYTRKSQALAETRRQAEQAEQSARETRNTLLAQLEAFSTPKAEEPNWLELAEKDPAKYIRERARWDADTGARRQAEQLYGQIVAEVQAEGMETLRKSIPEWADPQIVEAEAKAMYAVAGDYGFQQQEIDAILDPRQLQVLRDAMKWRELQKAKPAITAKVAVAPKQMGSAAGSNAAQSGLQKQLTAALERAKDGSIETATEVLRIKREIGAQRSKR